MAKRTEAYLDTSAFIAFMDGSDSYHSLFVRKFSDPPRLITTTLVVAEGHGWFLRRFDPVRGLQFLSMIEQLSPLTVLAVGKKEQSAGTEFLRHFSDQALTMVDAVGLHVMDSRDVEQCWSTDYHLGLTGVPLIIHQH